MRVAIPQKENNSIPVKSKKPIPTQTEVSQNPLLRLAEQAKLVEELSKLALLEEKHHGKASTLTERKAKAAVAKLGQLIDGL